MKRKSLWNSLLVFCLIGFGTIASFISCEVGLGSAVDVAAPDINITTPPTAAVIRQSFAIAGDWSDDGTIKSLEVTLKNTNTKKEYKLNEGNVKQQEDTKDFKGTWDVIVDPLDTKNPIPDGSYEATISITDNGKHKTQITRSFVIDNTPPVVVLQRPSSKAGDSISDLFGQTLSLTGQAADDNNIKEIHINFYSDPECTDKLLDAPIIKTNIPPTISLDVAKFEEDILNDYAKIYGSKKKEGKKPPVYYTITAYDEAQRFPITEQDAKEDDSLGNATDTYYLYDDIYADVLADFKVTNIYSILNGSFTDSDASRAASAQNIPEILKNYKIKAGKFQLNPANNPEFKVVGREGLEKDENGKLLAYNFANPANDLTNESNITVKIDVGLDAIPLNIQTLRVYLLPVSADGSVDDKPENRIYPEPSDPPYEKNGTGYTFTTKIIKDACKDKDGNAVTLTVGNPYVIAIEGYDSMRNEAVAEEGKVFGFRLAPNGAAPILDINTSINSAALSGDSMLYVPRFNPADTTKITSLKFEGTVTVEDGVPTVEYSIDGGARSALTITATGNKGEFSFEKAITVDDFVFEDSSAEAKKKSGQHNIIFYANQTQDATPVKKTLMYQVDGPKVTMSRLNPTAYNYYYGENGALVEDGKAEYETINGKDVTKKYLNGKNVIIPVTIMAGAVGLDISDAKKPVIEFIQGGETKLTMDAPDFGDTDPIDTTKFAEGELLIRITAYDQAGNKGTAQETYYVKQATDVPVILPKNSVDSTIFRTKEQVADSNEKNIYSANQTVSYRLIDDDGLKSAAYEIWRQEAGGLETQMKTLEETKINLNETTDYQLEIKMEDTPATYRVLINTTDKNNLSHPGAQFFIRVTASAPTIDEISLSKTLFKEEVIEPQIVIKSDQKPFILYRVVKDPAGNEIAAYTKDFTKDDPGMGNLANESPTVGDHIEVSTAISSSGRYSVEYLVEDVNGKKSSISEKFFNVDLTAPVIDEVELNDAAITSSSWYNSTTLTLTVDVSDAEDVAGTSTSTVEYSTDDKAWDAADKIWTSLSYNSSKQKYSGSAVFGSEGDNNKLFVRATDKAGNVTYHKLSAGTPDCDTIKIDGSAPELTVSSNQTVYVMSGEPITVSGTYEDPHSGVNNLTFNIDGTDITPTVNYTAVANGADTWTTTFVPAISGKLGITGHNKAGLATSELKAFDIMIDTSAPQNSNVKFGAYKGLDTNNEPISEEAYLKPSDSKYYVNNNKTFVISGVSTDDTGIKSVTLKVENNISSSVGIITPTKNGSNSKWYFTFDMNNWNSQAKATVTVTDNAGRTTPEVFDIVFDKTAPKALHQVDSKNKDIYFRIGRADNDKKTNDDGTIDWETNEAVSTANNPYNEDVGKKYSFGTWGNDSTIEIRGTFEEKGAGLKAIHYAIFDAIPTAAQITALENGTLTITENNHVKLMSSFAPLTTAETRHVPFNTANGKESRTVESNFRTQLSGFDTKNNYLVLIAEDNAGNRAADTLAQTAGTALNSNWNSENHDTATPYYTINKDTTAPTITSTTPSRFTNGKEGAADLVITGTATDADAKVAYVTVTIEDESLTFSEKIEAKDFTGTDKDTWKATIAATQFSGKSGAFTVYAEAVDNAGVGNKKKISAATINVDTTGPNVKIIAPSDKTKVGTQFELKGTANDGTGAGLNAGQKVTLYYTKNSSVKMREPGPDVVTDGNPANGWVKLSARATLTEQDWNYTIDFANIRYSNSNQLVAPADANTTLYLQAEAVDSSGTGNHGFANKAVEIVVDRKSPSIASTGVFVDTTNVSTLTSSTSKWFNNTTVNLNGTFTDDGSGVASIRYQLKKGSGSYGDEQTVASDGEFSANVKGLAAGTNTIKVWAVDTAGNASTPTEYTVKVDNIAPSISSGPEGVIHADASSCPVELTVTDQGGSNIDTVTLTVGDNDPVPCSLVNGKYTKDIISLLEDGTVSVTATATDNAGNTTSRVIANVMLDTTGPQLAINTPAANAKTTNSITVSGSASDGTGSGIDNAADKGITLYYTTSSSVKANDPTSATTSTSASDAGSKWVAYGTKMTLDGQSWTGTFAVPTTVAGNNVHKTMYICVGAVDKSGSGNPGYSAPVTIVVDRKVPVSTALTIDEVAGSSLGSDTTTWFNNTTVSLSGTFTDAGGSGVASVKYAVKKDGASAYEADQTIASDGVYTANVKGLAAGTNTIKVWAVDTTGNASTAAEYTVKVDTSKPTVTSGHSSTEYANGSGTLTINATVTDTGSGLQSVVLSREGTTTTVSMTKGSGNAYSANALSLISGLNSGTVTLTATATDKAGNETKVAVASVMVDKAAPTININSPAANAKTASTVTVSGTASDGNGAGVNTTAGLTLYYTTSSTVGASAPTSSTIGTTAGSKWVAYTTQPTLNGQNWSCSVDTTGFTTASANTPVYFAVGGKDTSGTGNTGYSAPRAVTVDRKAPSIASSGVFVDTTNVSTLGSGTTKWFNNTTVNLNGTFEDDGSGVASVRYQLKKGDDAYGTAQVVASDGAFSTNIKELAAGTNTIKVWAVDTAGNASTSREYTVKVDAEIPVITATYSGVKYADASSCPIELTVTDGGSSGIASVTLTTDKGSVNCTKNTTTGKYEADVQTILPQGTASVTATATDNAGNSTSRVIANVMKDTEAPNVVISSPSANAKTSSTISLSGSVSDGVGSGIKESEGITLYYTKTASVGTVTPTASTISNWTAYTTKPTLSGQTWSGSFTVPATVAPDNANTTLYLCAGAVDNAGTGNKGYSTPVTVVVDKAKPAKSLFKVGTTEEASVSTTWFNNETLNINGTFTDAGGSGVSAIIYTLDSGTEQEIPTTDGTFNTNIAGFTTGGHTLAIRAKDKVGNESGSTSYTIQVDMFQPEISEVNTNDFTAITLTNGTGTRTFKFNVTDSGSGFDTVVSNIEIKAGSRAISNGSGSNASSITVSGNTVTVKLGATDLAAIATTPGTYSVTAKVKDIAGNESNAERIGVLKVDKDLPVPNFTSHNHKATVNKQITLSGTVTDTSNSAITAISLTATCGSTSKVYGYPTGTDGNITYSNGQWSYILNTTDFNNTVNAANMTLTLTATDAAGNIGSAPPPNPNNTTEPMTLSINQNSDRPEVKLTSVKFNADGSRFGYENSEITGTLSDDDGIPTEMAYRLGTSGNFIDSEDTNSKLTYSNVDGSFSITLDDDEYDLYFKIKDSANGEFVSKVNPVGLDLLSMPILKDKIGTIFGANDSGIKNTIIKMTIDTNTPDVETPEFTIDNGTNWQIGIGSQNFGGTKKNKFKIRQNAYDKNTVKIMTVKVIEVVNGSDSATPKFNKTYDTTAAQNPYVPVSINKGTKTYLQFTSDEINVTGWKSTGKNSDGNSYSYRLEITMSDGIKESITKLDLSIDNTAPVISFSGPAADSVNSGEITVYGTTDELGEIYYTVSTDGQNKPSSDTGKTLVSWSGYSVDENGNRTAKTGTIENKDVPEYVKIPNAGVSWYVYFDGNTTDTQRAHGVQLKNFASILGLTNDLGNFKDLVNFYIWIKVDDAVGNSEEYPYLVCVDPQGDRPSITLSNPETPGESVGGTVKLYGTAEDSNGTVESVWVQLLSKKNNGTDGTGYGSVEQTDNKITSFSPTSKDLDFWNSNGYTVAKMKPDNNGNHTEWTGTTTNPGSTTVDAAEYGIQANFSGTSWSLKINSNSEFNPDTDSGSANDMAVRIFACDDAKNLSYAVTRYFKMDNDTPVISNVMLKQYAQNDTTFESSISSQEARIGMYVKGKWYLEFTANDDESLDSIVLTDSDGNDTTLEQNLSPTPDIKIKTKNIRYELPTANGVGSFKQTIKATDTNNHTGTYEIEINYDNEAPKLLMDTVTEFGIDPNVHQSNGFYRLSSKVSDASVTGTPSGVKAVGFYFMRREAADEGLIYDPMQKRATPLSTKDLTYADGLYWISGSIKCKEDGSIELQTDLSEKAAYIHTGSYIRLDGVMYKITTFDGTNTITIEESHATSYKTAQIALALFVDNQKSEYEATTDKNANGYYTSIKNDDGDGMVEELGGTSALATWSCSIVSSNIPDGPIEIHYTAYDAALNYAVGVVGNENKTTYLTYSTLEKAAISGDPTTDGQYASYVYTYKDDDEAFVSNNAPRLAGVLVATDTNGNGRIDEGENGESISTWNSAVFEYTTWDKSQKELIIPADSTTATPVSIFTTKGLTRIEPEIIGGNGELMYNYTVSKRNSGNTDWATPYYTKTTLTTIATQTDATYQGAATVTPIEFTVKDFLTAGTTGSEIVDADNQKFTFTIWDSTDGTTCGTNSQKAKLDIVMSVKLRDTTPPEAKINPFFWESLNENSIYGSDAKDANGKFVVKTVNELAGHVELEPNATTNPDLSGKVVLRGTATDTKMVKKLYISIPEMATKFAGVNGMTTETVTDDSVNPVVETDYYLAATYNSTTGAWTTYGNLATNGFAMKITKSEFSATGHSVEWEFDWDTTAISATAPAQEGIVVKVLAEDEGIPSLSGDNVTYTTNKSGEGTAQTTSGTKTAKYTVDVVPYITEITRDTTISGGVMNRSKLGSYPVSEGETLTVTGFNLKGGKWAVGRTTNQNLTNFAQNATTGKDSFTMTVPAYSGDLKVTVGGVESVNNTNRTDLTGNEEIFTMKGSSVKYTAEDNRYLAVWNLGNYFKYTNDGAELQKPVMTADKSGNLYASWAAQSNSNIMFSYGVNQNTTAIFRCFDQPAIYTGISFNTKGTNGGANIAFIPEQQGSSGTFAVHGLSSSQNVGGMGAIQVLAADITAKTSKSGLKVQMNGNPAFDNMDSGGNATNYWNIANYDMTRRLGSYTNPRSAKYNSYLHNIWYDEVTESIRYSVINATDANISKFANNAGGIVGWVVIDGGYTGQDRLHNFTASASTNDGINNKLVSYGYIHTGVTKNDVDTKPRTFGNSAIYDSNIFFRASNITQQTGANDKTSITFSANNSGLTPAVGDTIALMENTAGKYYISLRKITGVTDNTISWSNTVPVTHQINTATVYKGDINAIGGSVNNLDASAKYKGSSGSSADIDVDTSGYPVIAYLDDSSSRLRIAKANSVEPKLASNWTRTITNISCSGSVSMRIDSSDNIHIMYKNEDGQLCYLFGTPATGNTYNFNAPEIIDETGSMDYGSLSVIESTTGTGESVVTTCVPCVTYLNSAGTAQAVKYAVRSSAPAYDEDSTASDTLSEDWDFMILPSLGTGHYAVKENQVSLEARKTGWTAGTGTTLQNGGDQATATPATVQAAIAFKSTQFETAYLKTE